MCENIGKGVLVVEEICVRENRRRKVGERGAGF